MLKLCFVIAISTIFLLHRVTAASGGCLPLPIPHFQWLNPDGSLVIPSNDGNGGVLSRDGEQFNCYESSSNDECRPLPGTPSCRFCSSNATLVCQGSDVYNVPSPATLPSTKLSLYKISGDGLISLPPKCFMGLSIQKLVIKNSSLSYIALETFFGVKSLKSLYLKNNMLDYIPQAGDLFQNINDLSYLSLEDSGLKVLTSAGSANMHNLTYFSLAGNPLYTMDVSFLQNSSLTFLDLRNITLKMKNEDIKGIGLNKLPSSLHTIDLSRATITAGAIEKLMQQLDGKKITTLSLSYLQTQIQSFWVLRHIKNYLQKLSLKGTDLNSIFSYPTTMKSHIFNSFQFISMTELNLDNCNITFLTSGEIFTAFPNLEILSLAENEIFNLDLNLFTYLPKLLFGDFSGTSLYNILPTLNTDSKNIQGLDFSNSYIVLDESDSDVFFSSLKNIQMLSFCNAKLSDSLGTSLLSLNNLKYLDLSAILPNSDLETLHINQLLLNNNATLTELRFTQNNFKLTSDCPLFFSQLTSLETLDLSSNSIRELSDGMFAQNLKTLNISQNLITTWYFSVLKNESQLQYLDVSNNQITFISDAMIEDFYKLDSLSLDSNPLICHNKVVALVCSYIKNSTHNYNDTTRGSQNDTGMINSQNLNLINWQQYKCYDLFSNGFRQFSQEKDCNEYYEEVSTTINPENPTTQYDDQKTTTLIQPSTQKTAWNWEWIYFIVGPIVLISALGSIVYLKWWNIRCFIHRYFSLKKARLLLKNGNLLAKPEVYYDMFVSYSDVDRAWVLDHLLPNMEGDGDVSLCFHERDFQVGMTILENIIDCMDRSHALLLVVSSAFIYSKWCQFEMHLAQYRLVETFRDQLVLVLLEDIPRKVRPQTLHHLMMTKTYLMWPQQPCKDDAYELFWRRLKRAIRPNPNYTLPVE